MCTISSLRKIQVKVPAVQSQSPAVSSEAGDLLSVTDRATGDPFLIHTGSIGSGFKSARDVSNVAHCKEVVVIGSVTEYTTARHVTQICCHPNRGTELCASEQ